MHNIVLIGYMGSGKSTVGARLSDRLGIPFEDTDKMIEREQGMSVSEIFEKYGEESFRRMETELLSKLLEKEVGMVLALGGGTPMRQENQEAIKALGTVVYLRTKPETVLKRLKGDTTRPLLAGANAGEKVRAMMETRNPVYEALSDVAVDTDEKKLQRIVDEIEEKMNEITRY